MTTIEPEPRAPWAMQLAARVEKLDPPTTADVCAAAGLAVVGVLSDERSKPGGPWADAIEQWQGGGRIRKLVRRGRASAWERAQEPDGSTALVGTAEVRAFVPSPMDQVPDAVAKLQIKSTPLDEPERETVEPAATGAVVVFVTPEVEMSWGKAAAQSAHAVQLWWRAQDDVGRHQWEHGGRPVRVVHARPSLWAQELRAADEFGPVRRAVVVKDGGFTEIPPGTRTAIARLL